MGYSLADLVKDLQRLKTSLVRGMMDGLYHSLYPRLVTDEQRTDLDDLLVRAPVLLFAYRATHRQLFTVEHAMGGSQAFPMLQYIDGQLQRRTGITEMECRARYNVLQVKRARKLLMNSRWRLELVSS